MDENYIQPVIIYGWNELISNSSIDPCWLTEQYGGAIQKFTACMVNNICDKAMYGTQCIIDNNGTIIIDQETKCYVDEAFKDFVKYNENIPDAHYLQITFCAAIKGFICQDTHNLYKYVGKRPYEIKQYEETKHKSTWIGDDDDNEHEKYLRWIYD